MDLFNDLFLLERLDHLIRTKATGSPAQLANRLDICERHLYRLIGQLRDGGFSIEYCKISGSYYYTASVELRFDMVVGGEKLLSIKGDEKKLNFFFATDFFCQ